MFLLVFILCWFVFLYINHRNKFFFTNKFLYLCKKLPKWISKWFSQLSFSFLSRWFALPDLVAREICADFWHGPADYHRGKWFCYENSFIWSNNENMDDLLRFQLTHESWAMTLTNHASYHNFPCTIVPFRLHGFHSINPYCRSLWINFWYQKTFHRHFTTIPFKESYNFCIFSNFSSVCYTNAVNTMSTKTILGVWTVTKMKYGGIHFFAKRMRS